MKPYLSTLAALLALLLLAACAPVTRPAAQVGMANPASVNCEDQGGTLEIRQDVGGEVGYCLFADGSECEEWALMRGECAPGQSNASAAGAETFTDPFAYCAAVGTIDAPDARYTGEQPPAAVVEGIRQAFDAPADTPADFYANGTYWRCADGQVKACFVGANLPCEAKADLSETPNEGTVAFCKENPSAEVVPAAAAGRATVFTWSCADGAPVKGEQVAQADAQGFIADFWYVIEPPAAASGAYVPIAADACAALQADAETALGVAFTMSEAPFFDYISQEGGTGCQLTATATGADFIIPEANPTSVVDALKFFFTFQHEAGGWEEDAQYAADGPTGAGIGMTRDAALLLILAEWTPDPAANCPADQPISACELTPEQQLYTVTIQAAASASPAAAADPYMPIPADACATLQADAEAALGVAFTMSEAPFLDYVSQESGTGCQLTATGTGADFGDPMAAVDALKAAFVGWEENMQYAAGGPTGMGIGMTRDAALLLILAEWTPDPAANCPADQPISACELTPEQQLYTVTVQAAMK